MSCFCCALAFALVSREPQGRRAPEEGLPRLPSERLDFGAPGRRRPPRSVFSTATCWPPKSQDAFKRDLARTDPRRRKGVGVLPQGRARRYFWPHVEQEYREETARHRRRRSGARRQARHLGHRGDERLARDSLLREMARQGRGRPAAAEHCSAFVATGSYTKDGRPVIGHNNWTSYLRRRRAGTSSSTSCRGAGTAS